MVVVRDFISSCLDCCSLRLFGSSFRSFWFLMAKFVFKIMGGPMAQRLSACRKAGVVGSRSRLGHAALSFSACGSCVWMQSWMISCRILRKAPSLTPPLTQTSSPLSERNTIALSCLSRGLHASCTQFTNSHHWLTASLN